MFAVIWRDAALDELADAFVTADYASRDEIERAVNELNARLAADPMTLGESRARETERIAFHGIISATYDVELSGRLVRVLHFRAK